MHDGMPYDLIQGQGRGHKCLKATQEESTVSPCTGLIFFNYVFITDFIVFTSL